MKEAFEKIKERLEEESQYSCFDCMERAISIVSEVEAEYMKNPMYQYAMVYAKNLVDFGVDVRDKLDSAVAQSMALNQAYIKGVDDERKRTYEAEYGNGWIPCSEKLPNNTDDVLVTTSYGLVIDAYLSTQKNWCFRNGTRITDLADMPIAWMPLPSPYTPTND